MTREKRMALLKKERVWAASYTSTPPALQGADLVRGGRYFVVMHHHEKCWLRRVGWHCSCKSHVRFFAAG
jgi:hypothetical protein